MIPPYSNLDSINFSVAAGSYAEQWAISHNVSYVVRNTGDPPTADTSESLEDAEASVTPEAVDEATSLCIKFLWRRAYMEN